MATQQPKKPLKGATKVHAPAERMPRGFARQVGSSLSAFNAASVYGFLANTDLSKMADYELAATTDETVKAALDLVKLSLIASLGPYQHKNPKIQTFVQEVLDRMETPWKLIVGEATYTAMWAGYGVGEILWKYRDGQIVIQDIPMYNPRTIYLVVDEHGRLTDGSEDVMKDQGRRSPTNPLKTGIYQFTFGISSGGRQVRIPLNKSFLVTHDRQYGNYYGRSAIRAVYQDWKYKVAAEEMLLVALDRYGTPVTYVVVPVGVTNDMIVDPATGEPRPMTMGEAASTAVANISSGTGMVLQNPTPDDKVQVGTLTTGNNFGESFENAIKLWNRSIFRGMLLPALLIDEHSGGMGSGAQSQIHFEVFKQVLRGIYEEVVTPFVKQVIGRLVQINFGETDPGEIPLEPFDPSTREVLSRVFAQYVEIGVADPSNLEDLNAMRRNAGLKAVDKPIVSKAPAVIDQKLLEAQAKQAANSVDLPVRQQDHLEQASKKDGEVKDAEIELKREDLKVKKQDLKQKQTMDAEKARMDHEHKLLTATHQHKQNMAAISKGLVATPAEAPGAPAAPKPSGKTAAKSGAEKSSKPTSAKKEK